MPLAAHYRAPIAVAALMLLAACDVSPAAGPAQTDASSTEAQARAGHRNGGGAALLRIEAEKARLVGAMRQGGDAGASGKRYAGVPGSGSGDDMKSYAEFAFRTPAAGTYRLRGRVRGPRREANSFFMRDADGETFVWHTPHSGDAYAEVYVTRDDKPLELTLAAGRNVVRVYRRENGTRLDWLELVPTSTSDKGTSVAKASGDDAPVVLRREAEKARLVGAMRQGRDAGASGKRYAGVPGSGSGDDMKSYAEFAFRTPATGTYRLRGRVRGPHREANSFFMRDADGETFVWHTPRSGNAYAEVYVTRDDKPLELTLAAGRNVVRVYRRENGTRLDWLELVPTSTTGGGSIEVADGSDDKAGTGGAVIPATPQLGAADPGTGSGGGRAPVREGPTEEVTVPGNPVVRAPEPTPERAAEAADESVVAEFEASAVLRLEAESGRLFGSMKIGKDGGASGGRYVSEPGSGSGQQLRDYVELSFRTTVPASYRLRARVMGPSKDANSFFVDMGDGDVWEWHVTRSGSYYAEEYAAREGGEVRVWLPAGSHALRVYRRERGARLDWIELERVPGEKPPAAGGNAIVVTDVRTGSGSPVPSAPSAPVPDTAGGSGGVDRSPEQEPARKTADGVDTTRGTIGGAAFWAAAGFGSAGSMSAEQRARIAEIERVLENDVEKDINLYECR